MDDWNRWCGIYGARCVTNSSAPSEVSVRTLWLDAMSHIWKVGSNNWRHRRDRGGVRTTIGHATSWRVGECTWDSTANKSLQSWLGVNLELHFWGFSDNFCKNHRYPARSIMNMCMSFPTNSHQVSKKTEWLESGVHEVQLDISSHDRFFHCQYHKCYLLLWRNQKWWSKCGAPKRVCDHRRTRRPNVRSSSTSTNT